MALQPELTWIDCQSQSPHQLCSGKVFCHDIPVLVVSRSVNQWADASPQNKQARRVLQPALSIPVASQQMAEVAQVQITSTCFCIHCHPSCFQ